MAQIAGNLKAVHTTDAVFPLSVEQYHEMIRVGVLSEDDPVELLEGVLVFHMPKNPPHRYITRAVFDLITALLPQGWHCQMQEPITLTDGEPEPDISVIRGMPADYRTRHPKSDDVAIVIEVSDSTRDRDRGAKYRSYARAGIPEYWIIDLIDRRVDVFRQPIADDGEPRYELTIPFHGSTSVPLELEGSPISQLEINQLLATLR